MWLCISAAGGWPWMDLTMEGWRGDLVGGKSYSVASIKPSLWRRTRHPCLSVTPGGFLWLSFVPGTNGSVLPGIAWRWVWPPPEAGKTEIPWIPQGHLLGSRGWDIMPISASEQPETNACLRGTMRDAKYVPAVKPSWKPCRACKEWELLVMGNDGMA